MCLPQDYNRTEEKNLWRIITNTLQVSFQSKYFIAIFFQITYK